MKNLFSFKREDYGIKNTNIAGLFTDYLKPHNTQNKTILLLHGASGCSVCWFPLMYLLYSYGYSVYAPSLPGHGKNPSISLHKIHIWDYIDYLKPVIETLKPDVIIGHSMGSILAQKLAISYPLKALVILSSIPPIQVKWKIGKPFARYFYSLLYGIPYLLGNQKPLNRAFDKHFIYTQTPKRHKRNMAIASLYDGHPGKETPHLFFDVFKKHFTSIKPDEISCPIFVGTGAKDPLMTYTTEKNIAKYYNAEFYALPNSGHFLLIEPGIIEMSKKIKDFLEQYFIK